MIQEEEEEGRFYGTLESIYVRVNVVLVDGYFRGIKRLRVMDDASSFTNFSFVVAGQGLSFFLLRMSNERGIIAFPCEDGGLNGREDYSEAADVFSIVFSFKGVFVFRHRVHFYSRFSLVSVYFTLDFSMSLLLG